MWTWPGIQRRASDVDSLNRPSGSKMRSSFRQFSSVVGGERFVAAATLIWRRDSGGCGQGALLSVKHRVTHQTETRPENLCHPYGDGKGHAQQRRATQRFKNHYPASLEGTEVQGDGKGQEIKPKREQARAGYGQ